MKNDNINQIKQAQTRPQRKLAYTDILVTTEVVEINLQRLVGNPLRRRRIDYAKKILNDPYLMNV